MNDPPVHQPVLVAEVMELLAVKPDGFYVDGTVGLGGHAAEILARSAPRGALLGVDRDAQALGHARRRLAAHGDRVRLLQADFRELPALLDEEARAPDGVLLDLGVSSWQLDDPLRGFSFRADGPLDMRMDQQAGDTAAALVNRLPERELADLIYAYGEERASRRMARAIVEARRRQRLETTGQLADLVRRVVRSRPGHHPATRTFQALRIAVNRELEGLAEAVAALARRLAPGGRLAVIAFHSLEDREVKHAFRELGRRGFRLLTRKPRRPGPDELRANPRARSARLRGLAREAGEGRA
jgi:16S rRNA (cytosine1402-N4)-methyltransferase